MNNNPFAAFDRVPEGMLAVFIFAVIIGLAIGLTIAIFYFLNLQNTLKQCAPQNQKMPPGQVWLSLIPLFNLYWNFRIATAVADSLAAEFRMRGIPQNEERPGYQIGMAYSILAVCAYVQYLGIPYLGQLCSLVGFVLWIVYWVKIYGYKKQLMEHHPFQFGNPNPYPFPNQPNQPNQPNNPYQNPYPNQPPNQNPGQYPNQFPPQQ